MDKLSQTFLQKNDRVLQSNAACGIIRQNKGFAICPTCRMTKLVRIRPDTVARNLQLYCRQCKREIVVDIHDSQCFESRG